jgi:hypothetical protein
MYVSNSTSAEPANLLRPPQNPIHSRSNEYPSLKSVTRRQQLYLTSVIYEVQICPLKSRISFRYLSCSGNIPEIHCFSVSRHQLTYSGQIFQSGVSVSPFKKDGRKTITLFVFRCSPVSYRASSPSGGWQVCRHFRRVICENHSITIRHFFTGLPGFGGQVTSCPGDPHPTISRTGWSTIAPLAKRS